MPAAIVTRSSSFTPQLFAGGPDCVEPLGELSPDCLVIGGVEAGGGDAGDVVAEPVV